MKIAFFLPKMATGGAERMRIALAASFLAKGHEVDFVFQQATGELISQIPPGAAVIDLGSIRARNSLIPLLKYLRYKRPDALISSFFEQNVVAALASLLAGSRKRTFITQHNNFSSETSSSLLRFRAAVYRIAIGLTARTIAVSEGVARDLVNVAHCDPARLKVVYNPACPLNHSELSNGLVEQEFASQPHPLVISVGRLTHQKGFDILLEAFALARRERELRLAVIGVGEDEGKLRQLAKELDIENCILWLGFKPNPLAYISKSNIFVMSSRYEGFGNVLVEALACGVPVVSTDCPSGPSEILKAGEFGRLVAVDDAKALADAILETLDNPVQRSLLQSRAEEFSADRISEEYLSLIGVSNV